MSGSRRGVVVTYPAGPEGQPLRHAARLNQRGEFLTVLPGSAVAVWRREAAVAVAPRGLRAVARDLSDEGHVVGYGVGPGMFEAHPFLWPGPSAGEPLRIEPVVGMAFGVNRRGQAWGAAYPVPRSAWDFAPLDVVAWDGGRLIPPPPGSVLLAGAPGRSDRINDRGEVAVDLDVEDATHAGLWRIGGDVVDLGTLGGPTSEVAAVNEAGDVVGSSLTAAGERHAFLWRDGEMLDLGTLGGPSSEAVGVNDRGDVIGTSRTAEGTGHGFVWCDGRMVKLDPAGATGGAASFHPVAINNRGQVVGCGRTADGRRRAVLWQDGYPTDLAAFLDGDAGDSDAVGINDRGQVLGRAGSRVVVWSTPAG